jgi:hypothetical protein
LERAAHQNSRRDAEAQATAWFTHTGVGTLLEIIQLAWPTVFPDAVGSLRQQREAYLPAGEDPDPEAYHIFQAKRQAAAKRKTEGEKSDDDREEGTSCKRRRLWKKVVEDEMDVNTEVPVRDRSDVNS